jgi:hypothetical protein
MKPHGTIASCRSWGLKQTSSQPPPPLEHDVHGEDFGGLTRRSQEPGGTRLQGSNRSNSSMGFGATTTNIHYLALYAIMFIELCFNFMSIFCIFIPHVVHYFFPVSPLVQVVQSCHRRVCLRYLQLIWGHLVIFWLSSGVAKWLLLRKANAKWGVQSVQPT